jgi:hypothetical protein
MVAVAVQCQGHDEQNDEHEGLERRSTVELLGVLLDVLAGSPRQGRDLLLLLVTQPLLQETCDAHAAHAPPHTG